MDKFAFVIHPVYEDDILRKFPLLKSIPDFIMTGAARLIPPLKVSEITGIRSEHNECTGEFIGCPLTSRQLLALPLEESLRKIIGCVRLAEKNGAKIVGLGAFTAVIGDGGLTVAQHSNIAVTTGNSYTVYTALEGAKYAAELMGIDWPNANIVVLGATGAVGRVCAQLLAKGNRYLTLVARQQNKLEKLAAEIMYTNGVAVKITGHLREALRNAEVVVAVSASVDYQIEPEYLRPGTIVCDVARPRDVSPRVAELRKDVLVIEGGIVDVPAGTEFNFDFGFPPGKAYACMAETMILTLEKRFENFSLGREMSIDKVEEIAKLAQKHGFKLSGLRSFERDITPAEVLRIKEMIPQKRL